MFTQAVIRCVLLSPLVYALSTFKRASVCNGNADLCSRSFGNVTFVGAHNSYAVGSTNLATNQDYNVTQQLHDGIRMLQIQAHSTDSGEIHLCHTDCILYDGGSLSSYLQSVKGWMDSNAQDILSILIVNINNLAASAFGQVFQSAGLSDLAYVPTVNPLPAGQWPNLGQMIDSGKRLVVFMDNGANDTTFPFLIPEFTNVWETAFDVTDPTFSCAVNRTQGDTSQQMYLINHFLDSNQPILGSFSSLAPDKGQLNVTNSASGPGSLGEQASDCSGQYGRAPNFMLVDFYNYGEGSVFQVAASLNGLPAPTNTIAPPLINGSASPSSSPSSARRVDLSGSAVVCLSMGMMISLVSGYALLA